MLFSYSVSFKLTCCTYLLNIDTLRKWSRASSQCVLRWSIWKAAFNRLVVNLGITWAGLRVVLSVKGWSVELWVCSIQVIDLLLWELTQSQHAQLHCRARRGSWGILGRRLSLVISGHGEGSLRGHKFCKESEECRRSKVVKASWVWFSGILS